MPGPIFNPPGLASGCASRARARASANACPPNGIASDRYLKLHYAIHPPRSLRPRGFNALGRPESTDIRINRRARKRREGKGEVKGKKKKTEALVLPQREKAQRSCGKVHYTRRVFRSRPVIPRTIFLGSSCSLRRNRVVIIASRLDSRSAQMPRGD